MVTDIQVQVQNKVASVIGAPVIICGNSDYTITFTFDTEWETLDVKTARFLYFSGNSVQYIDVVFSGRVATVPILKDIDEVKVGVYAGELHTTTPCRIICKQSILCGDSEAREEPSPDVYQQLMETINNLNTLPTASAVDKGRALMVNEEGRWVVRLPDFMHNQKNGDLVRFFFGTQAEWNAWTGDKTDCLFISTDDDTLERLEEEFNTAKDNYNTATENYTATVARLEAMEEKVDEIDENWTSVTEEGGVYVYKAHHADTADKLDGVRRSSFTNPATVGETVILAKRLLMKTDKVLEVTDIPSDGTTVTGGACCIYEDTISLAGRTFEVWMRSGEMYRVTPTSADFYVYVTHSHTHGSTLKDGYADQELVFFLKGGSSLNAGEGDTCLWVEMQTRYGGGGDFGYEQSVTVSRVYEIFE